MPIDISPRARDGWSGGALFTGKFWWRYVSALTDEPRHPLTSAPVSWIPGTRIAAWTEPERWHADGPALGRALKAVTVAWIFGAIWNALTTQSILNGFAVRLGCSPAQIGLVAAFPFLAAMLQVPATYLIERTGNRRGIFLAMLITQRSMWFLLVFVPALVYLAGGSGGGAALVFLVLFGVSWMVQGIGGPAWVSWMGDIVPPRIRGHYFAKRRQIGILAAVPAAVLGSMWLDWATGRGHGPAATVPAASGTADGTYFLAYGIVFGVAAAAGFIDILAFLRVPHVRLPVRVGEGGFQTLRNAWGDRRFRGISLMVAGCMFCSCFLDAMLPLFLRERLGCDTTTGQLMLLVVPMAVLWLVLPAWGLAIQRFPARSLLKLAAWSLVPVAGLWLFVGPQTWWLGFFLTGATVVFVTGIDQVNFHEMISRVRSGGSGYLAVNQLITAGSAAVAGLTSGFIAGRLRGLNITPIEGWKTFSGFDVIFAVALGLRLVVAVFMIRLVDREHDWKSRNAGATAAARMMGQMVAGYVGGLAMVPVRMIWR
jgi:Major Facilitator Superfamily